jgi:hypothetical protein
MLTSLSTREHPLHITADSRTRGVLSALTIVSKRDAQQRPLISLVQRKQAIDKGLTCTELYTLLALAAKKLAQPLVEDTTVYQVDDIVSNSRCKLIYTLGRYAVVLLPLGATDYCEHSILVPAVDDTRAAGACREDRNTTWPVPKLP